MEIDIIQVVNIAIGALVSSLISLFIIVYIEKLKLPCLELSIEESAHEHNYPPGYPVKYQKSLRLIVKNRPLPGFLNWFLSRTAALNCRANISFHHLDGQNVFGRRMKGRWPSTPEPIALRGKVGDQDLILFDPVRANTDSRVDIYAGDKTLLDIASRFDNDDEAYGWSNDSYFSEPLWKAQQWKLPKEKRYLVEVNIISSNTESTALFRIINDVPVRDFRLEEALPNDRVIN